ncbi:MAG: alpha/beta fold hydrolase [Pseudomonadales bacterium]|nr:alpha/beta fold hydrolase [Pseudomonadales bacterium]
MNQEDTGQRVLELGPEDADATLILLHGLGADADDLAPVAQYLDLPETLRLRIVLPDAPVRPITVNGGMRMRAWYDISPETGLDSGREEIDASVASAKALVAREAERGVPPARIVVGGFSQGGVIALETGLGHDERLAGIVALSTYLHDPDHVTERVSLVNAEAEIFMAHGRSDPMIPIQRAATSRTLLEQLGYRVRWREYVMGHELCMDELRDLSAWLGERLG